ncbi:hypothetical protein B7C42_02525 [Nocardia cerradoensis]|uniref:Uncharacterized protein n=1 Tax=Nocardia cerradoensis TaxID=85688 RepID=A0A231H996_9NOCA|nr:hypothetical protein B7C42_02525 [Nocardia cerradoensis]
MDAAQRNPVTRHPPGTASRSTPPERHPPPLDAPSGSSPTNRPTDLRIPPPEPSPPGNPAAEPPPPGIPAAERTPPGDIPPEPPPRRVGTSPGVRSPTPSGGDHTTSGNTTPLPSTRRAVTGPPRPRRADTTGASGPATSRPLGRSRTPSGSGARRPQHAPTDKPRNTSRSPRTRRRQPRRAPLAHTSGEPSTAQWCAPRGGPSRCAATPQPAAR